MPAWDELANERGGGAEAAGARRIRTRRRSIRIRSGREPRGRGRASHARGPSGLAVGHPRTSQGPPGVRGTAPGETQSRTLGVALGYRRRRGPGAKRGTQAKPRRGRCGPAPRLRPAVREKALPTCVYSLLFPPPFPARCFQAQTQMPMEQKIPTCFDLEKSFLS